MRRSILSSVAVWLDHIFPRYVIKARFSKKKKKKLFNMKCVLWFFLEILSQTFLIVGKGKFHPTAGREGPEGE